MNQRVLVVSLLALFTACVPTDVELGDKEDGLAGATGEPSGIDASPPDHDAGPADATPALWDVGPLDATPPPWDVALLDAGPSEIDAGPVTAFGGQVTFDPVAPLNDAGALYFTAEVAGTSEAWSVAGGEPSVSNAYVLMTYGCNGNPLPYHVELQGCVSDVYPSDLRQCLQIRLDDEAIGTISGQYWDLGGVRYDVTSGQVQMTASPYTGNYFGDDPGDLAVGTFSVTVVSTAGTTRQIQGQFTLRVGAAYLLC
jgi:hypothetical protein